MIQKLELKKYVIAHYGHEGEALLNTCSVAEVGVCYHMVR